LHEEIKLEPAVETARERVREAKNGGIRAPCYFSCVEVKLRGASRLHFLECRRVVSMSIFDKPKEFIYRECAYD